MTQRRYPDECLQRLNELDVKEIIGFFENIPEKDRRYILSVYRAPSGLGAALNLNVGPLLKRLS